LKLEEAKLSLTTVSKVWGEEIIVINNDDYCCKFLVVRKDACSSAHFHKEKNETFFVLSGEIVLEMDGNKHLFNEYASPLTIRHGTIHKFQGIVDSIILEVSTHHKESDVVRLSKSKANIQE
jgi:mannose-6-phosphate isomerase-like protein (cupin superfamily)